MNQEIQEAQKTQEPQSEPQSEPQKSEGPQKREEPLKEKNQKRVAAGKKGAEARWKQKQAQTLEAEPIKITREPQLPERQPTVTVYKNYIPLCVMIGAVGVGIYMIYSKTEIKQPQSQPKSQPKIPEIQTSIDPFEMR